MATMTKRTTFALDPKTIERIKHLAAHWKVSQAEAVRRAVELTEQDILHNSENTLLRLRDYHREGGIAREKAEDYLDEVYKARESWRD
ncbi:MAG: CopG family transcriptional regulator [Spirochaetia bacterium]